MSLLLRLTIPLAVILLLVFGYVGLAAVGIAGDTVEQGLQARLESAIRTITANPEFFVIEASFRGREEHLRQLAGMSGFEIVVPAVDGGVVAGSSLPREQAVEAVTRAPGLDRFDLVLDGVGYRCARVIVRRRLVMLLTPAAPIEAAKSEARRRVLVVAGIGLLLTLWLAAILALAVTRPIRRLAAVAGGVSEDGERPEFPSGGGPEVEAVRDALVKMIGRLDRYREELVAREKMATLGRFSAAVAHEIRNPLSSMRMTLDLLAEDADESLTEEIDFLRAEAARLDHSVEELLFHAGKPRYEMGAIDLGAVVEQAKKMLAPLAHHLGIGLVTDRAEVATTGDPNRLRQALVNLGLNALHASAPGDEVRIASGRDGEDAMLVVSDRGPGVPEEIAERVFEPFVSGRSGGTGLGLAVTAAIMEAHGGRVEHEREDGETRFILRLSAGRR